MTTFLPRQRRDLVDGDRRSQAKEGCKDPLQSRPCGVGACRPAPPSYGPAWRTLRAFTCRTHPAQRFSCGTTRPGAKMSEENLAAQMAGIIMKALQRSRQEPISPHGDSRPKIPGAQGRPSKSGVFEQQCGGGAPGDAARPEGRMTRERQAFRRRGFLASVVVPPPWSSGSSSRGLPGPVSPHGPRDGTDSSR